ncbi:hypothetical protein QJS04_geneDACA013513 [Acorus gramineus]|uniref:BRCT domain-containing protein n=1 Tax=Acorus gramineus TaxID=55184 RepID=A0AAV9AI48_ACOGR|nr:hypothetical protein QJS04_geneDACA013513 [Acorus gramineus]
MTGVSRVEVIDSKGCSRLLVGLGTPLHSLGSPRSYSSRSMASSLPASDMSMKPSTSGPFAGLTICVTGLSKEARKQVMAATERLGGRYSSTLHPQCTHLVVQSFGGRKFEHALNHGLKNGLLVVTLGWFVDSVKRNVRLNESLYSVKSVGQNGLPVGDLNRLVGFTNAEKSCVPVLAYDESRLSNTNLQTFLQPPGQDSTGSWRPILASDRIYIDSNISPDLKTKVLEASAREGTIHLDNWFVGCRASFVVCEGPSIHKYLGHVNHLVTPLWILKTLKEKNMQRLVHLSTDLARQVSIILESVQSVLSEQNIVNFFQDANRQNVTHDAVVGESPFYKKTKQSTEERQHLAELAKLGVRNRRSRRMRTCQAPFHPLTPSSLLGSICWSITEPTSSACIYMETSEGEDAIEQHTSAFFDAQQDRSLEESFENFSRPLRDSEKQEVIYKNHFLTILFPIDRYGEMGPSSRTFFSDGGFTCLQVLDHIYAFYQENMSPMEIEVAIYSDSKHADRLRSLYASKGSSETNVLTFKRIDFLGSRRSFELLKRISGENNTTVYELLIKA